MLVEASDAELVRYASAALGTLDAAARMNTEAYRCGGLAARLCVAPGATLRKPADFALQEPLTPFHSTNPPPITLEQLVDCVFVRLPAGSFPTRDRALLALCAVATCRRYERLTGIKVSHAMAHRLVATALLVCAKAFMDFVVSNRLYSRASGVPLYELNQLEARLLSAVAFAIPLPPPDASPCAAADWEFLAPAAPAACAAALDARDESEETCSVSRMSSIISRRDSDVQSTVAPCESASDDESDGEAVADVRDLALAPGPRRNAVQLPRRRD